MTDGSGRAIFAGLPPGVYSVSEQVQAGWDEMDDKNPQTVILTTTTDQDCEETEVIFRNKELAGDLRIYGYKWFQAWYKPLKGSPMVGLSSWVITATLVGTDTYTTTMTNGLGYYEFPAASLKAAGMAFPGATIEVCEEARYNWIAKTPECVRVTFPYPGARRLHRRPGGLHQLSGPADWRIIVCRAHDYGVCRLQRQLHRAAR